MRLGLVLLCAAIAFAGCSSLATAQTQDMCSGPLPYQADPGTVTLFRQRCTIQKLLGQVSELQDRVTVAEVDAAVQAGHAAAQTEALSSERDKAEKLAEYWKTYAARPAPSPKLARAIDRACGWRGVQSEPTAAMCALWRRER